MDTSEDLPHALLAIVASYDSDANVVECHRQGGLRRLLGPNRDWAVTNQATKHENRSLLRSRHYRGFMSFLARNGMCISDYHAHRTICARLPLVACSILKLTPPTRIFESDVEWRVVVTLHHSFVATKRRIRSLLACIDDPLFANAQNHAKGGLPRILDVQSMRRTLIQMYELSNFGRDSHKRK